MSFFHTFCQMLTILFAIALGILAHHLGYMGAETDRKFSKILLNITMPCMIISSVLSKDAVTDFSAVVSVLKAAIIFYGLELLLAMLLPRFIGGTEEQQGVWRYLMVFPNIGFIGFPVSVALFGQGSLFYATILNLPFNLLNHTIGPLLLAGKSRLHWKQILSPCVIAAVTALFLALTGIRPPELINDMLTFVGDITVPLSLLVVGSLLADLPAKEIFSSPRVWMMTILRLLAFPVLLWLIMRGMGFSNMILNVSVTLMAMPAAINGSLLCLEYGGDQPTMAQTTFVSTLASILTIPILAALLF